MILPYFLGFQMFYLPVSAVRMERKRVSFPILPARLFAVSRPNSPSRVQTNVISNNKDKTGKEIRL